MKNSIYVALCTSPITDDVTIVEPLDVAYSRVLVTSWIVSESNMIVTAPEDDVIVFSVKNTHDIVFQKATSKWKNITHIAVLDALTGGNIIAWQELTYSTPIDVGYVPRLVANTLDIIL